MKKRHSLFFLLSMLLTVSLMPSCGDDDGSAQTLDQLLGTWSFTGITIFSCSDPSLERSENDLCRDDGCLKWQFREGGIISATQISNSDFDIARGTYAVSGNQLTITFNGQSQTGTVRFTENAFYFSRPDPNNDCQAESEFSTDD